MSGSSRRCTPAIPFSPSCCPNKMTVTVICQISTWVSLNSADQKKSSKLTSSLYLLENGAGILNKALVCSRSLPPKAFWIKNVPKLFSSKQYTLPSPLVGFWRGICVWRLSVSIGVGARWERTSARVRSPFIPLRWAPTRATISSDSSRSLFRWIRQSTTLHSINKELTTDHQ